MRKDVSKLFVDKALEEFAFLKDEGFTHLEINRERFDITYNSEDFSIEIGYDTHENCIACIVEGAFGDRNPRASLSCLYVQAHLGPEQDIISRILTMHSLSKALDSNSRALRLLLPVLKSPARGKLLLKCNGR
jgi:hypothetical protein